MSTIPVLIQFRDSLVMFFDELISLFPQEGDFVLIRIFVKDRVPMVDLMNIFILKILPTKTMINKRNEDFFLNDASLFDDVIKEEQKSKIIKYKKLWRSKSLDKDDKMVIWKWLESFVFIAEKYQNSMIS